MGFLRSHKACSDSTYVIDPIFIREEQLFESTVTKVSMYEVMNSRIWNLWKYQELCNSISCVILSEIKKNNSILGIQNILQI